MEHRWSLRKRIQRHVSLEFFKTGSMAVTLRDISTGGVFVENIPVALPPNAVGAVSFSLPYGDAYQHFHLEATVVHQNRIGAGLMFLDTEVELVRALWGVLAQCPAGVNGGDRYSTSYVQTLSNA